MSVELLTVPLVTIDPPAASIRQHIPEALIDELATSIQAVGLIEPLVCERTGDRLRIIAGHRRFLACKRAGLVHVEVVIRADRDINIGAVQVHENIIRQDMTPAEEARLFQKAYEELGEDVEAVAGRFRLGVGYVEGRLLLLQGDPEVLGALDREEISLGVAEELNKIVREDYRRERLDVAVRGGATVAMARQWRHDVNRLAGIQPPPPQSNGDTPPAAPAYVPIAQSLNCWFCESGEDLHLLRLLHMHDGCIRAAYTMLKKIGSQG